MEASEHSRGRGCRTRRRTLQRNIPCKRETSRKRVGLCGGESPWIEGYDGIVSAGAAEEESAALAGTPLLSSAPLAHVNCILAKLEVCVFVCVCVCCVDVIEQLPWRLYCLQSMRVRASSSTLVSLSTAADWRLLNDDICECSLGDMISEKAILFINIPCRRELGMISQLRRHFLSLIVNINISSVF